MGRAVHVDAVVAPSELSLELADELARLEPCGLGNPGVTLLAPATTLTSVETMSEGKHVRMAVELGGFRCRAVGFGMGRDAPVLRQSGRHDVAFRLQRNQWNGTVTPQMLVRAVRTLDTQAPAAGPTPALAAGSGCLVDARGQGTQIATIARLLAGGDDVLVVVAERARRQAMLTGVLHPARFGAAGIALAEWDELPEAAAGFGALVLLDPPQDECLLPLVGELAERAAVHVVWGEAEIAFARSVAAEREPLRPAGTVAACLQVLEELGLDPSAPRAERVDLEASASFRAAQEHLRESLEFLGRLESGGLTLDAAPEPVAAAV
jgi:single-stranded-DNA-specific exonuclease